MRLFFIATAFHSAPVHTSISVLWYIHILSPKSVHQIMLFSTLFLTLVAGTRAAPSGGKSGSPTPSKPTCPGTNYVDTFDNRNVAIGLDQDNTVACTAGGALCYEYVSVQVFEVTRLTFKDLSCSLSKTLLLRRFPPAKKAF